MDIFNEYLETIEDLKNRERMKDTLEWIVRSFPNLKPKIAWNQPMFTDHETFIIGFSVSKNHMAVAPEKIGIHYFSDEIKKIGYTHTQQLVRVPWNKPIDLSLLSRMIEFNINDKMNCKTFWRK